MSQILWTSKSVWSKIYRKNNKYDGKITNRGKSFLGEEKNKKNEDVEEKEGSNGSVMIMVKKAIGIKLNFV